MHNYLFMFSFELQNKMVHMDHGNSEKNSLILIVGFKASPHTTIKWLVIILNEIELLSGINLVRVYK